MILTKRVPCGQCGQWLQKRALLVATSVLAASCSGDAKPPAVTAGPSTVSSAATMSGLDLAPSTITGGLPAQGTVALVAAAPSGGTVVTLSSANPIVTVPGSTTVQAGATAATFTITTQPVAQAMDVSIRAATGADSRDAMLHVVPAPDLASVDLASSTVTAGQNAQGTVRLTTAALQNVDVTVSSSSSAAIVPRTVSVPRGSSGATFTITTQNLGNDTSAVITATLGVVSKTTTLRVTLAPLETYFLYTSEPGDWLGAGQSARLAPPANSFAAGEQCSENWLEVKIGPFEHSWTIWMNAPPGQRLGPGVYTNATQTARVQGRPGLMIVGDARGCNTSTGSFTVQEAAYSSSGNVLRFRASLELHCEGAAAAFRGELSLMSPPYFENTALCFIQASSIPFVRR